MTESRSRVLVRAIRCVVADVVRFASSMIRDTAYMPTASPLGLTEMWRLLAGLGMSSCPQDLIREASARLDTLSHVMRQDASLPVWGMPDQ